MSHASLRRRVAAEAAHAEKLKPVGLPVIVKKDDGTAVETVTTSEPWLMGGHSWMVKVEGFSGGYSVDCVFPKVEVSK